MLGYGLGLRVRVLGVSLLTGRHAIVAQNYVAMLRTPVYLPMCIANNERNSVLLSPKPRYNEAQRIPNSRRNPWDPKPQGLKRCLLCASWSFTKCKSCRSEPNALNPTHLEPSTDVGTPRATRGPADYPCTHEQECAGKPAECLSVLAGPVLWGFMSSRLRGYSRGLPN